MEKNFIIAGFGGQGVLLAGEVLATAFMLAGKKVTWYPSYGAEMRGGTVNCEVVASDEEVRKAAELANCMDFIERLPEGFDTAIGENGAELSGGERQRLSIARAFLKDAPILILDEISASLDVDNEKKIQESLNKLIKNKTVIIISHRLKSIENVNKIVVIDNGVVETSGTHDELMNKSKVYKKLIQKTKLAEEFNY